MVWADDGTGASDVGSDGQSAPVLHQDVTEALTGAGPDVVVHRADRVRLDSVRFLGWYLPAPQVLGPVALVGALLDLFLIMDVPPPWRLTRWAWFWAGFTPVGALLFAVLAGPTPGVPGPRHPQRRVGGLAAFVASLVAAPLLHWGSS